MTFLESSQARTHAEVAELASLLTALGHPVRLRIVDGLLSGECCVGNMAECLQLPQPLVSRHLAILREAGVVSVQRMGRQRSYRVIHPDAARLLQCLGKQQAPATTDEPTTTRSEHHVQSRAIRQ